MIVPNCGPWPFVAGAIALIVVLPRARPDASAQRRDPPAPVERSWPMFGGSPSRNMVNASEWDLPADWCVLDGQRKHIKWVAELGDPQFAAIVSAHT